MTYKEQLALRTYLRQNHVPGWRKQVDADENLKEDEFQSLVLLDKLLYEAGKPEVERILQRRKLDKQLEK